jgi:hypothetical protein
MKLYKNKQRSIKEIVKGTVKAGISKALNNHNHDRSDDILLFCSGRSGSTWLTEMISVEEGVKYSNQPPDWWRHDRWLPSYEEVPDQLFGLSEDALSALAEYYKSIITGRIEVNPPWNIFSDEFSRDTDRYIIKICNSNCIIDKIVERIDGRYIYLSRHPIAVSHSRIKKGGEPSTSWFKTKEYERYIVNEVSRLSHSDYRKLCKESEEAEAKIKIFVIQWIMENIHPMRYAKEDDQIMYVRYEDLVIEKGKSLRKLSEYLNIPVTSLNKRYNVPSNTTTKKSKEKINNRDKKEIISEWKKEYESQDIDHIDSILEIAGIEEYKAGRVY